MGDIQDGTIASPHWDACESCKNYDAGKGCTLGGSISMSLVMGDWIVCDDYEAADSET